MTRDLHVAVHYIGSAEQTADGIGVPSRAGAFIECLAERVGHVTIVAFDRPANPGFADGVEYTVRTPNVSLVSLGEKGTWRDFLARRRRLPSVIAPASAEWDVLLFYHLPNRRAHLVYDSSVCERVAAFVVGTTAPGALDRRLRRLPILLVNRTWHRIQMRQILKRSDLLFVNSEELLDTVSPHPRCVRVVSLSHRRARHSYRRADRMDGPEIDLLVAGRITLEKGVLIAVDAFAALKRDGIRGRLHVVGEGPAIEAVLQRAGEHGLRDDVVLHGWIPAGDRLFEVYRQMDVLLLPIYGDEGFPSVSWEAMSQSVLVVTTRVRGAREAFRHEQEVMFVPMHDAAAVADAVRRLSSEPELRRTLIANGFERAEETTMERTIESVLNAVSECWPDLAGPRS